MQRKRLVSDSTANASFAFAAVFIMMAVTASSAVVSKCEDSAQEFAQSSSEAELMSNVRSMIASEMELVIQGATSKALVSMHRNLDIGRLGEEIGRIIREHLATSYPTTLNSHSLDVKLINISASLSERYASRDPGSPVPSAVVIHVELEISAIGEHSEYRSKLDLSHELESPIIFLSSKLEQLDFSAGIEGDVGDTVRSILTQLVQLRILQGYASPHNISSALNDLLNSADVEFAVNLAITLQELSDFGSIDKSSWKELQRRASAANIDLDSAWFSAAVDPFKTFILMNDRNVQGGVNLHDFALQTLYSMVDQLVVRFLEYYHIIDLANSALSAGHSLDSGWHDFVLFMTGIDSKLEEMIDELAALLSNIGVPDLAWKDLFGGAQDISFASKPSTVMMFDSRGALAKVTVGGASFSIDLPTMSILNSSIWKDYCEEISQEAIRAGAAVEKIVLTLCRGIANLMPHEQIYGSLSSSEQYIQSILNSLENRLASVQTYTISTAIYAQTASSYRSGIAVLRQFVDDNWDTIFPFAEAKTLGCKALAKKLADTAVVNDLSVMPSGWKQTIEAIVARELTGSMHSWEADLRSEINRSALTAKNVLLACIDNRLSMQDANSATIAGSISKWVEEGIPVETMISGLRCQARQLALQVRNMSDESQLNSAVAAIPVPGLKLMNELSAERDVSNSSFSFAPKLSQIPAYIERVEIQPSRTYTVDNVNGTGRLIISIFRPDSEAKCRPKSSHYTGFDVLSSYPYETNWVVRAKGSFKLYAVDSLNPSSQVSRDICINIEIPITAVSGWPLQGVQYSTSDNLVGDALELLGKIKNQIWEYISPFIAAHQKALDVLMDSLSELSKYINGFAERLAEVFNKFGDILISACLKVLERIQNSTLWKFIELYLDICGTVEARFNYGPATIIVSTSLPDLLFRKAKDLVRIIFVFNLEKMNVSIGFRLAKLSNGMLDIIANSTVDVRDLRIEMRLDPLMAIRDHFIEIRGSWRNFCLQVWSPEVNDYKRFSMQLSDIPILGPILSNIPIPILGISVSINAGLILKYNVPICDSLVINEVELNPPNRDSGKEWVELYNPLSKEMDVAGWTIETMHGEIAIITLSGTIPSKGVRAFTFPKASLDNGNTGDTFAMGDSILLRDPDGNAQDVTPLISDTANDAKTWHRSWDGSPKWVFGTGTKGHSNGNSQLHAFPDIFLKLCIDSLYLAIQDEMGNVSASLDFVRNLLASFLRELIGQVAEFAASMVEEATLFIEIGVNDLSGSVGGGFRLRVSADGEIFRQLVIWFAEQITKLFGRVLFNKEMSTHLLKGCKPLEAIYIGFDLFGKMGLPNWIKGIVKFTGAPTELKIALSFSMSLATVAKMFGLNYGKFCLKFGVHIDDLPGVSLVGPLALHRDRVDLWLLKGQLTMS